MLPEPGPGLALVKSAVRSQAAYTLVAPSAPRKLNQNESPLDLPPGLRARILARAGELHWNRYPAFVPQELHARLAARWDWVPEGILVGNGSNELIEATLAVVVGQGDGVVTSSPSFALYQLLTAVLGGRHLPVPAGPDFRHDVEAVIARARAESARVVLLNSPNNPTGASLPSGAVERVLAETGAMVVCDEAYQEFGGPTAIPLLRTSSRLVVLRTFSKAMGIAGLRCGYALAHPDIAREIWKAKLPYNVNAITLAAAELVLDEDEVARGRVADIIRERERAIVALRKIPGLQVYPSEANFFLVRCESVPAGDVFTRLHRDHGILVRDVSAGPGLAGCLRISVGTPEDMDAVVAALRDIFGA
jgi:histidinol-phosphate aminotransferase